MNTRYRLKRRLFRAPLIVVQVEETRIHTDPWFHDSWTTKHWRDAKAEDLLNGETVC